MIFWYNKQDMSSQYILVLDIGTTGVKAFVFDADLNPRARVYLPLEKSYPQKGWVEQNPSELVKTSQKALRQAVKQSGVSASSFVGLGITNQRETTILWNKKTGRPVYPAIVWEDLRTAKYCQILSKKFNKQVREKTGLTIDPYFSASKIHWILSHIPTAKKSAQEKNLLFGTVDTWILWNFLKGQPHLTDMTNASRTCLFNIKTKKWDKDLIKIFFRKEDCLSIEKILPRVQPSASHFGKTKSEILGFSLPILAVCGDQQASLAAALNSSEIRLPRRSAFGRAPRNDFCNTTKVTYGTGTFIMQILGPKFSLHEPFFTTLAPTTGKRIYVLEYKIACCGKKVKSLLKQPAKLRCLYLNLAKQVADRLKQLPVRPKEIIVDGGVSRSDELLRLQSEAAKLPVRRQKIYDGTALGVAGLMV